MDTSVIGFRWPVTTGSSLARGYILVDVQRLYLGGRTEVDAALVEVHHSPNHPKRVIPAVFEIVFPGGHWQVVSDNTLFWRWAMPATFLTFMDAKIPDINITHL